MCQKQLYLVSILWMMITQSICLRYDWPTASFIRDGPITVGYSSWIVISTVDMQALWDQKEVFSNTVGILEDEKIKKVATLYKK